jgi:hypothetical protein
MDAVVLVGGVLSPRVIYIYTDEAGCCRCWIRERYGKQVER